MLGLDKKSPAFRLSFPGGGRNRSMRVRRRPARRQDAMPRLHHLSIAHHLNTTPFVGSFSGSILVRAGFPDGRNDGRGALGDSTTYYGARP